MPDQLAFDYPELSEKEKRDERLHAMLDREYARHRVEAHRWREALRAGDDGPFLENIYLQLIARAELMASFASEAINRQIKESYGYCQTCVREIPEDQLIALPFRMDCKNCETRKRFTTTANQSKRPLILSG